MNQSILVKISLTFDLIKLQNQRLATTQSEYRKGKSTVLLIQTNRPYIALINHIAHPQSAISCCLQLGKTRKHQSNRKDN